MKTITKKEWLPLKKCCISACIFPFFPLIFPPFLGIDHLENVSMRYRYPKVLGYRVLGIGIDPALVDIRDGVGTGNSSDEGDLTVTRSPGVDLESIKI